MLNPLDSRSFEFIERLYEALLPNFDADLINIGCDETFEIGQGETKEECEKIGAGKVYLDFITKLHNLITEKYNYTPMCWDEIVFKHPDLIPQIPKNIILIDWGYEYNYPYEEHCKTYRKHGLRFYVSPGTSAWNSICGRTINMIENLRISSECGKKYGAEGFLLTDWGDGGQPQPIATCIASYVLGGIYSWHTESYEKKDVEKVISDAAYFANKYIFRTGFDLFDWILRLGKYYCLEDVRYENCTVTWNNFLGCNPMRFPMIYSYANELLDEIEGIELNCEYSDLIKGELENACRLLMIISEPERINGQAEIWKENYIKHWDIRSKHEGYEINIIHMNNFVGNVLNRKANGENIAKGKTDIKFTY